MSKIPGRIIAISTESPTSESIGQVFVVTEFGRVFSAVNDCRPDEMQWTEVSLTLVKENH